MVKERLSWHELHPGPCDEEIREYGRMPIDDLVNSYREDLKIIWHEDYHKMEDGKAEDLFKQMDAKQGVLHDRVGYVALGYIRYDITGVHPEVDY